MNPDEMRLPEGPAEGTPEWVVSVLKGFKVHVRKSADQGNLFTAGHTRYDVSIVFEHPYGKTEKIWNGPYQCPSGKDVDPCDVLQCVCDDAIAWEDCGRTVERWFHDHFDDNGQSYTKTLEAMEGCSRSWDMLHDAGVDIYAVANAAGMADGPFRGAVELVADGEDVTKGEDDA